MFIKKGAEGVLLFALMMALLSGCGNNLSEQDDMGIASTALSAEDEQAEALGGTEIKSSESFPAEDASKVEAENTGGEERQDTSKTEAGNTGRQETQGTSKMEAGNTSVQEMQGASKAGDENTREQETADASKMEGKETSAMQLKTNENAENGKAVIYEGLYFDERFYQYVDRPAEESPLIYCEIVISHVTDTSFDFTVNEKVMATGESTVLIPTGTAAIEEPGSKAVYKGDGMTLTFSFPDDPNTFPQHVEVSGLEKLENKVYMNNTIPGHESG